ncbi:hypothetical protein BASA81_003420 [Batrachochytrium salamandrivorans]|nr:hypothetical protein BASA81_003420 [Batrachochytrium salamandrivorans]
MQQQQQYYAGDQQQQYYDNGQQQQQQYQGDYQDYQHVPTPQEEIERNEYYNGIRWTWNEFPLTKVDQERAVFKLAGLYTPLKPLAQGLTGVVNYDPVRCKAQTCQGVLNPWCAVDFQNKTWGCPFCFARNAFPPHYASQISETTLPAELMAENSTIEYQLSAREVGAPIFLFCIDTAIPTEELDELKDSLAQCITLLPPESLVGLITFGAHVQIHELGFQTRQSSQQGAPQQAPGTGVCSKAYVFRGEKGVTPEKMFQMLGMLRSTAAATAPGGAPTQASASSHMPPGVERFLAPVGEVSASLDAIIDDLARDPWPTSRENRPQRCTGVALSVAVTMLEKMCAKRGARIMLFVGGPCTVGEGAVAEEKLASALRSHTDIEKGRAQLLKPAKVFYEKLAARLVENCHAVDTFICSLDQTGMLEMKSCVERTGGFAVLADSFGQSVFKESFRRVFARHANTEEVTSEDRGHLQMGLAGTLEIVCSPEIKIKGAIGPCASLNKKGPNVSEVEIGQAGTFAWRLGAMSSTSSVAFYLDTAMTADPNSRQRFVQFITHYQHPNGKTRVRVTTTAGPWQREPGSIKSISHSFDQQCAVVCLARVAILRIEEGESSLEVIRFIDRNLIKFCTQFAQFQKENPSSFALNEEFALFPQFLFHLRRGHFCSTTNTSPDESAYYRMTFCREDLGNCVVMIQSTLVSYSPAQLVGQPVLLDSSSIRPDTMLLLDSYFVVVVFHGENIAAWREQGYQDLPEHVAFRNLLNAPKDDAQRLMSVRMPQPRYIVCDQHKSQSRFLMSKVNPSTTHNTQDGDFSGGGQAVFTDDANFKSFMDHLRKIVVSADN